MGGHRASGAGDDLVDGPVDLAAVRADDALLDAIAGGRGDSAAHGAGYGFGAGPAASDQADDERLAAVLAAWRADIEADPMPELVGLDEAVEAVTAGHEAHDRVRSRARRRMPFAIAAAAAVVAVAGMTVAVHGSKPGDTLFGVSKVFFSEHAAQVQRVEDVRTNIERANDAINRGDREAARRALEAANLGLPALPEPDRDPLQTRRDELQESLAPQPPAASSPPRSESRAPSGAVGEPQPQRPGAGAADSRDTRPGPGPGPATGTGTDTGPAPESSEGSPSSPDTSTSDQAPDTREAPATPPASPTTTTTQGLSSPPASSPTN